MKKIEDNNTLVRSLSSTSTIVNLQSYSIGGLGCLSAAVPCLVAHFGAARPSGQLCRKGKAVYRISWQPIVDPDLTAFVGLFGSAAPQRAAYCLL